MLNDTIDLSNAQLSVRFGDADVLTSAHAPSWLGPASPLFAVHLGAQVLTARTPGVQIAPMETTASAGMQTARARFVYRDHGIAVVNHFVLYDDTALFEIWQTVCNTGTAPVTITRLDSLALTLDAAACELLSFTGDWGSEFEPVRAPVAALPLLESRSGRSSKGNHPWCALFRPDGAILSAAVAWSGNWALRFMPDTNGAIQFSGGLHDWQFAHTLVPGASLDSPPVAVALGAGGDLNSVSTQYARVGRRHWYPNNSFSQRLPVEWNHWWSYEDSMIDEQVFRANVDIAAMFGVEVCTLDAGWFGPTESGSHWYDYRGDWADVNTARFPSGLRALSDYVHDHGMAFGLWCEIEALGQHARLAEQQPTFVARRGGERLGYVCFGSPAVQEWAFGMLSQLIEMYRLDWIKLDFNLDPGAGCDRTDHGHGAGDGLHAHYQGYYQTLERLRARFPDVVLENCSSGGLRIDLGMLRRTLPTFLSDPDWPAHGLQLIWGASTMLAPNAWLHWGFSEWINGHPTQTFNPRDPQLQAHQLDYYIRIGMLGAFGLSQKLPDLPAWAAAQYVAHIDLYKTTLRRFVRVADFYRLTAQPRRDGSGERWAAFQYAIPDDAQHLVAVFRLPGGAPERTLHLYRLEPARVYTLTWLHSDRTEQRRGAQLIADGLHINDLPEEGSALILLQ